MPDDWWPRLAGQPFLGSDSKTVEPVRFFVKRWQCFVHLRFPKSLVFIEASQATLKRKRQVRHVRVSIKFEQQSESLEHTDSWLWTNHGGACMCCTQSRASIKMINPVTVEVVMLASKSKRYELRSDCATPWPCFAGEAVVYYRYRRKLKEEGTTGSWRQRQTNCFDTFSTFSQCHGTACCTRLDSTAPMIQLRRSTKATIRDPSRVSLCGSSSIVQSFFGSSWSLQTKATSRMSLLRFGFTRHAGGSNGSNGGKPQRAVPAAAHFPRQDGSGLGTVEYETVASAVIDLTEPAETSGSGATAIPKKSRVSGPRKKHA